MSAPITMGDAEERGLLAAKDADVHTFSNGTDWDSWASGNCHECRFFDAEVAGRLCAFESAAFLHMVTPELATLFGWTQRTTQYGPRSGWRPPESCPFFRERGEDDDDTPPVPEPDPTQLVLLADPTEDAALLARITPTRVPAPAVSLLCLGGTE